MIVVRMLGGLGNQLFQYALGRRLTYGTDDRLALDLSWYSDEWEKFSERTFKLDNFATTFSVASERDVRDIIPGGRRGTNTARRLCRYCPALVQTTCNYVLEIQKNYLWRWTPEVCTTRVPRCHSFEPSILDITGPAYLDGFWQTERYFHDFGSVLRSDLTVTDPVEGWDEDLLHRISETNSVGVHVRRGDFVDIGHALPAAYFERAVSEIESRVSNPHFYVFSDGIEWAKRRITIPHPTTYVSNRYADADYEDLRYLSECRHHVISNSTFGWWGAWLGEHPDQRVIAPSRWTYHDLPTRSLDVVPERWDVIEG